MTIQPDQRPVWRAKAEQHLARAAEIVAELDAVAAREGRIVQTALSGQLLERAAVEAAIGHGYATLATGPGRTVMRARE